MNTLEQLLSNNSVYLDYLARLEHLAYTMFEWNGLPDEIPARYIEKTLHENGSILFFHDEEMGYVAQKCAPTCKSIYDEPLGFNVVSHGGKYWTRTTANAVLIYNNPTRRPTNTTLQLYAMKLYEADTTISVNVKAQKTPVLIKGTKTQQLTLKNLYKAYDGNEPVIFADKQQDLPSLEALTTNAPYVTDKLMLYKHDVWNECLTFLGIKTSNTDKKERMVTAEAEANNKHSEYNIYTLLAEREEACRQINAMFGLNVSVSIRGEDVSRETSETETPDEGVE